MPVLPKGYYAVTTEPSATFEYKGVYYDTEPGVNVFGSLHEASEHATEIPETVLAGLDYTEFRTPVLIFSAGQYSIDSYNFNRSVALLGANACVNPLIRSGEDAPSLNPVRASDGETILKGSYWRGRMTIYADDVLMDGFSQKGVSIRDFRSKRDPSGAARSCVVFRNIVQKGPCGSNSYYFSNPDADSDLHRRISFENIYAKDYDDYGYGTFFAKVCGSEVILDNIYFDTSEQNFGLSDYSGGKVNCETNSEVSEYTIRNCYFRNLEGVRGVSILARGVDKNALRVTVENCSFTNASREDESPLNVCLPTADSSLKIRKCAFVETRNRDKAAVIVTGGEDNVEISDCVFRGFKEPCEKRPITVVVAPDYLVSSKKDRKTDCPDSHVVKGTDNEDFTVLDGLYAGRKAYYGDQHAHTDSGGTSDGSLPIGKWVAEMDEKKVDFAIIVDHQQMRGFFLPEWNDERFVMGTEPGAKITEGLLGAHESQRTIHYNMLVPHKYGIAMIMANFPEFNFRGDELTGRFDYPPFTKDRFLELTKYVQSIGGMMVHPHPKTMLSSKNPLDYYFGEHTYIETIYEYPVTSDTFKNYELWNQLLLLGKHVYASSGSDTHSHVSNAALSTFYTKERSGKAFFDQMHSGDYTVGEVGIQMSIDEYPMGSEAIYRDGMTLSVRVRDFYEYAFKENTAYELRIQTDKGLAYKALFNGKQPQKVQLEVQKRAFYRAEIFDVTNEVWVAHGNPIWLN